MRHLRPLLVLIGLAFAVLGTANAAHADPPVTVGNGTIDARLGSSWTFVQCHLPDAGC